MADCCLQHCRHPMGRVRTRVRLWCRLRQPLASVQWRDTAFDRPIANVDRIYTQGNKRFFDRDCLLSSCLVLAADLEGRLAPIFGSLWDPPFVQRGAPWCLVSLAQSRWQLGAICNPCSLSLPAFWQYPPAACRTFADRKMAFESRATFCCSCQAARKDRHWAWFSRRNGHRSDGLSGQSWGHTFSCRFSTARIDARFLIRQRRIVAAQAPPPSCCSNGFHLCLVAALEFLGERDRSSWALVLAVTLTAQIALGALNVILLAPVWLQMTHLLVAEVFWILIVLASADLLFVDQHFSALLVRERTSEVIWSPSAP